MLLAGNPNAGKTTVFNALSGARARVGNYPGITVQETVARLELGDGNAVDLVDVPGTYSLTARSPEEQVAVDAALGRAGTLPDVVVLVVDATTLGRGLYLALQVLECGAPAVVALNMMDEAARDGFSIDTEALAQDLGVEVVCMTASRGEGVADLRGAIARALRKTGSPERQHAVLSAALDADLARLERGIAQALPSLPVAARRPWAQWLLLSSDADLPGVPGPLVAEARRIHGEAAAGGRDLDLEIIGARYERVDAVTDRVLRRNRPVGRGWTERIDGVLLNPVGGGLAFVAAAFVGFEALFTWSEPAMAAVEGAIGWAQTVLASLLPPGLMLDLLSNGVVAGVGNVLVFVPQIALLFLLIAALEDSGYLARLTFAIDPVMSRLGLHGRAFVPLLSGFACAVPAVMATRTIENRRDRLLTMMALPFMSCSARLPVYVLVIGTVFASETRLLGLVSHGAVALLAMYGLSLLATLAAAAVLGRTVLRGPRPALVLELPPYRLPGARNLFRGTWERVHAFLRDAGTIILAFTLILWGLLTFPHSDEIENRYAARSAELAQVVPAAERASEQARLDRIEAAEQLEHSAAGRIGKALEPGIQYLGFDWRIGVSLVGAFAAREVFVSTMAMVFGIAEGDAESAPLRSALADARREDGSRLMTPLTGVSLMVFFVLACQCMSTLAIVRRESGSWRWPAFMLAFMSTVAYVASLLVFQIGSALGWGVT